MKSSATIGGGCFWCIEAVFEQIDGVLDVEAGYAGGHTEYPSYEEVCSGSTGHAEVVRISFDPEVISYGRILDLFWKAHNPTTPDRQGSDVGSQYRSIILYHDEEQRLIAEQSREALEGSGTYKNPVVTEISPLETYYSAEEYHQDYFAKHPFAGYCTFVIRPKLKKMNLPSR